jgi:glycosyltransferase involved in cell wall biosynthesis
VTEPTVSIILPVYNRLGVLQQAIGSALGQTYDDWEMIVADDGSGNETRAYLRALSDPRISVLWLSHNGMPARVRNAAIKGARGRYLAFLDSDDIWSPTKIERQIELLGRRPECRWCYTALDLVDPDGRKVMPHAYAPWLQYEGDVVERLLRLEAHVAAPSVLVERTLVAEVGGFDENQRFGEDYDMWIRLAVRSPVAVVPEPLTTVRTGGARHLSSDRIGAYEGWVRLYGKHAVSLPTPVLRAIARRRRAESVLVLAGLHATAGRARIAWWTLLRGAPWNWRAAKTAVRAGLEAFRL